MANHFSIAPVKFLASLVGRTLLLAGVLSVGAAPLDQGRHAVLSEHPRLLGSLAELRQMAKDRPQEYQRVCAVARAPAGDDYSKIQAIHTPARIGDFLVITNGQGKLFLQTLLPVRADVTLVSGDDLYRFGDQSFPPRRNTGPAPECRIEVSPANPSAEDLFLHVLTTAAAHTASVPKATVSVRGQGLEVTLGDTRLEFQSQAVGGQLTIDGQQHRLADSVQATTN